MRRSLHDVEAGLPTLIGRPNPDKHHRNVAKVENANYDIQKPQSDAPSHISPRKSGAITGMSTLTHVRAMSPISTAAAIYNERMERQKRGKGNYASLPSDTHIRRAPGGYQPTKTHHMYQQNPIQPETSRLHSDQNGLGSSIKLHGENSGGGVSYSDAAGVSKLLRAGHAVQQVYAASTASQLSHSAYPNFQIKSTLEEELQGALEEISRYEITLAAWKLRYYIEHLRLSGTRHAAHEMKAVVVGLRSRLKEVNTDDNDDEQTNTGAQNNLKKMHKALKKQLEKAVTENAQQLLAHDKLKYQYETLNVEHSNLKRAYTTLTIECDALNSSRREEARRLAEEKTRWEDSHYVENSAIRLIVYVIRRYLRRKVKLQTSKRESEQIQIAALKAKEHVLQVEIAALEADDGRVGASVLSAAQLREATLQKELCEADRLQALRRAKLEATALRKEYQRLERAKKAEDMLETRRRSILVASRIEEANQKTLMMKKAAEVMQKHVRGFIARSRVKWRGDMVAPTTAGDLSRDMAARRLQRFFRVFHAISVNRYTGRDTTSALVTGKGHQDKPNLDHVKPSTPISRQVHKPSRFSSLSQVKEWDENNSDLGQKTKKELIGLIHETQSQREGMQEMLAEITWRYHQAEKTIRDLTEDLSSVDTVLNRIDAERQAERGEWALRASEMQQMQDTLSTLEMLIVQTVEAREREAMRKSEFEMRTLDAEERCFNMTGYSRFLEEQLFEARKREKQMVAARDHGLIGGKTRVGTGSGFSMGSESGNIGGDHEDNSFDIPVIQNGRGRSSSNRNASVNGMGQSFGGAKVGKPLLNEDVEDFENLFASANESNESDSEHNSDIDNHQTRLQSQGNGANVLKIKGKASSTDTQEVSLTATIGTPKSNKFSPIGDTKLNAQQSIGARVRHDSKLLTHRRRDTGGVGARLQQTGHESAIVINEVHEEENEEQDSEGLATADQGDGTTDVGTELATNAEQAEEEETEQDESEEEEEEEEEDDGRPEHAKQGRQVVARAKIVRETEVRISNKASIRSKVAQNALEEYKVIAEKQARKDEEARVELIIHALKVQLNDKDTVLHAREVEWSTERKAHMAAIENLHKEIESLKIVRVAPDPPLTVDHFASKDSSRGPYSMFKGAKKVNPYTTSIMASRSFVALQSLLDIASDDTWFCGTLTQIRAVVEPVLALRKELEKDAADIQNKLDDTLAPIIHKRQMHREAIKEWLRTFRELTGRDPEAGDKNTSMNFQNFAKQYLATQDEFVRALNIIRGMALQAELKRYKYESGAHFVLRITGKRPLPFKYRFAPPLECWNDVEDPMSIKLTVSDDRKAQSLAAQTYAVLTLVSTIPTTEDMILSPESTISPPHGGSPTLTDKKVSQFQRLLEELPEFKTSTIPESPDLKHLEGEIVRVRLARSHHERVTGV